MNHIYDAAKEKIVIEVSGGVVQEVYASNPEAVKVMLVDWDNIDASEDEDGEPTEGAVEYEASPFLIMPAETREALETAGENYDDE